MKAKKKQQSVSQYARERILKGRTNREVFSDLQRKFGKARITEEHAHYPCWYRCELRRKGLLPKKFDQVGGKK